MSSKPITACSRRPERHWHAALAFATFLATAVLPMAAVAEPGDEECFQQFYRYGHWPTEPGCPASTRGTPVDLGLTYCISLNSGVVERFCMNDVSNAGGPSDPPIPPTPEECTTFVGNPVHAGNQNKYQYEVDIEGAGSMPLDFARHYNSNSGYADGVLGSSWRHTYSRKLLVSDTNLPATVAAMVSAERADGKVWQFKQAVDGTWPPISGDIVLRLIELKSGSTRTGWELRDFGTGNVEVYDATGRLDRITRLDGAALVMAYDVPGRLASVTDAITGRQLTFQYDNVTELMSSVTAPDGQAHRFGYDSNFPRNLTTVTRPDDTPGNATDNPVRTYLYDEPAYSADFSVMHLLTGIQDERGNRYATFRYDADRAAIGTEHAGGVDSNSLAYNGTTTTVTTPLGAQIALNFTTINGRKLPVSASQPACAGGLAVKNFSYDANANVTARQDFRGTRTCSAYESTRRLETIRVDGLGTTCPSNLSTYTPPTPASPTDNVVVRKVTTQWHPFWHFKTREASPKRITTWVYNGQPDPTNGNTVLTCAPAGSIVAGQPLGVLCKRVEQATTDETGGQGFGASATGLARVWQYTYNANGQQLTADGPRTDVVDITTFTYFTSTDVTGCSTVGDICHRQGDLWKVTNALNQVMEFVTYDLGGRVARSRDANATITDRSYHPRGWLRQSIVRSSTSGNASALDAVRSMDYSVTGELEKVTQPDGSYLRYEYDLARRLTDVVDPLGNRVHYALDAAGNREVERHYDNSYNPATPSVGLKREVTRDYDQMNRLQQERDALARPVTTYQRTLGAQLIADGYDDNGNAVHTIDGLGVEREIAYDSLNRPTQTTDDYLGTVPATSNTVTSYTYDARGNLQKVTDPDSVATTYHADGLDQVTSIESSDTGTTTFGFDAAGNVASRTDNGGSPITFTRDAINRLTSINYPTTSLNVTLAYDQPDSITGCIGSNFVGRLTRMTDGSGTTTYCYDRRGNVTSKTQVTLGKALATSYTYTKSDNVESLVYPSGGKAAYVRDSAARITGVSWQSSPMAAATPVVSNVTYYPFGPANAFTFGNGQVLTKTYDKNYVIDSVTSSAAAGLMLDFSTDVMSNITSGSTVLGGTPMRQYVYDRLYRLTGVKDGANAMQEGYSYNKTGGRLTKQIAGQPTQAYTYVAGTHRLDAIDGATRNYDSNGNTTDLGDGQPLVFDEANRLVIAGAGIVHTFSYSGKGERVAISRSSATQGGGNVRYLYDAPGTLLAELAYGNHDILSRSAEYVYMEGVPVAMAESGAITYLETDHLGTPRVGIDDLTNAQIYSWDFFESAFGENETVDSVGISLRYPGQVADGSTSIGLRYNYFRDYEPGTGRYIESDPIGLRGGSNTYAYVGSNAINRFDMLGLYQCTCVLENLGRGWVNRRAQVRCEYRCGCYCDDGNRRKDYYIQEITTAGWLSSATTLPCRLPDRMEMLTRPAISFDTNDARWNFFSNWRDRAAQFHSDMQSTCSKCTDQ